MEKSKKVFRKIKNIPGSSTLLGDLLAEAMPEKADEVEEAMVAEIQEHNRQETLQTVKTKKGKKRRGNNPPTNKR